MKLRPEFARAYDRATWYKRLGWFGRIYGRVLYEAKCWRYRRKRRRNHWTEHCAYFPDTPTVRIWERPTD